MTIIDLIEPHNCEESSKANMTNITDLSTPNPNYSKGVLQVDPQPEGFHDKESIFQDRRAKEFLRKDSKLVTSTAPFGVLSQIEGTKTGHIPNRPIPSSSEEGIGLLGI